MIDLSNNENTLLSHEFKTLNHNLICKYPCDNEYLLKNELAKIHNVSSNNITLGCGSSDVIYRTFIALNFLAKEQKKELNLIVPMPTFDLILSIAKSLKIKITYINELVLDVKKIIPNEGFINLIYITNPNNPSANELSQDDLDYLTKLCVGNTYMILDEAYAEYNVNFKSIKKAYFKNIIITRTFSKIYALAGLRIGYGIACEELLQYINKFILIDNINYYALYCALEVLKNDDFINTSRKLTLQNKAILESAFNELDIKYFKSNVNFILHEIKDEQYSDFMLELGIKVGRKIANYPLLNRISVGNINEIEQFLKALKLAKDKALV